MTPREAEARGRSYPHTIDNGGGERLTFVARRRDERGEYLEGHNSVAQGAGPPMHVHHVQEESLTVERGTLGYQRKGQPEQSARPGETVTFPPGDAPLLERRRRRARVHRDHPSAGQRGVLPGRDLRVHGAARR